MKKLNFKGSALLQVLVLSALISTIVVVLLKFAITRTSNTIQTKNIINGKLAMQSCMAMLNKEEARRINMGLPSYFETNTEFPCSVNNYSAVITPGTGFSYGTGIVRPLEFKITFFQPGEDEEENDNDTIQVESVDISSPVE